MEKKKVGCPFCGCEKQIGEDCPKCGRGGVILKVEDVVAGCRYHKPLSEHDSFDSAYEAACKLFDDGTWEDFLIDDGGHLTSLPGYRLVKETCPKCGKEARRSRCTAPVTTTASRFAVFVRSATSAS